MTDAELVEAVALERQVSELTRKNCELQEKLDEYENAYKFIVDDKCFNEEKHCACTPILRAKVKELEAENAMLKARLEPIETAHREYEEYPSSAIVKRDAYRELENAAIALVQRLELDKDVKKNNWWLNERAKIMEVIDDNEGCDEN